MSAPPAMPSSRLHFSLKNTACCNPTLKWIIWSAFCLEHWRWICSPGTGTLLLLFNLMVPAKKLRKELSTVVPLLFSPHDLNSRLFYLTWSKLLLRSDRDKSPRNRPRPGSSDSRFLSWAPFASLFANAKRTVSPQEQLHLAENITEACWLMYAGSETGIAPEISKFGQAGLRNDLGSMHYLLRPETVESLWYMYKLTSKASDIDLRRSQGWLTLSTLHVQVPSFQGILDISFTGGKSHKRLTLAASLSSAIRRSSTLLMPIQDKIISPATSWQRPWSTSIFSLVLKMIYPRINS